jgi:hypothetical protein
VIFCYANKLFCLQSKLALLRWRCHEKYYTFLSLLIPSPPSLPCCCTSSTPPQKSISTTDNVDADAGVGHSFQPSSYSNSGVVGVSAVRTVTPGGAPTAVHEAPPKDVARSLFIKKTINPSNIPSQHICPLTQELPFVGVHFDVPDANGVITEQVYKQSLLYWFMATLGTMNAHWNVFHPLKNRASVPRTLAWNLACPATAVLQVLLHQEQHVLGFPLVDENPLTVVD